MKPFHSIYAKIKNALDDLPGEAAHVEMYPKRPVSSKEIEAVGQYKTSAVMALIYEDLGPKMILTQRHDYKGNHGGQVSFPGGKKEDVDADTIATALRETKEEIGIDPSKIEVYGKLTDVYIPVSGYLVHPYLGFYSGEATFIPEEREVKEVITFDLSTLTSDHVIQKRDIKTAGIVLKDIPCFIIEDKIVWGATALMLNEIRMMLIR